MSANLDRRNLKLKLVFIKPSNSPVTEHPVMIPLKLELLVVPEVGDILLALLLVVDRAPEDIATSFNLLTT